MSTNPPKIVVTGATSMIGQFLLRRLTAAGYEVHAVSRKHKAEPVTTAQVGRIIWHTADISHPEQLPRLSAEAWIHLGPLWLLPPLLTLLQAQNIPRVICFGSTSLFSKAASDNAGERQMVAQLAGAEKAIQDADKWYGIHWTIFRPTLIYDCVHDKNITFIARFIACYGCFPVFGRASGLRQPVHADDLAAACIDVLDNVATYGKAYNLSGGETLNYREMVERIFTALGKRQRVFTIPLWLFRLAIRALSLFPGKRNLTAEMAKRMNKDLCFDHTDAIRDFAYHPRQLTLTFDRKLLK